MNAHSLTEPAIPRPGDRILDRYVVESMVATGGMGVVLSARHELLDERFAIKVLQPDMLGSSDVAQRFLREAQACVGLRGEHTVRVFDVGSLPSGLPFMVMELLVGHDLRRELSQRGHLPVEEAATWALQACHALAEIHARGIVHRDIKPSNLFLSRQPDGRRIVKVIDFGISKVHRGAQGTGDSELTQSEGLLGSPQYMSPEQVRSASRVDHRTDIWSLGAVLYESLVGMPPFGGESVTSVSAMIVADEPTPLERLRPGLPRMLIDAVMRCLNKDREQRLQSVAELAALLEPFAIEAPSPSGRVSSLLSGSRGLASPRASTNPRDTLPDEPVTLGSGVLGSGAHGSVRGEAQRAAFPIQRSVDARAKDTRAALAFRVVVSGVGVCALLAFSFWLVHSLSNSRAARSPAPSSSALAASAKATPHDAARRAPELGVVRQRAEPGPPGAEKALVSAESPVVPKSGASERGVRESHPGHGEPSPRSDKATDPVGGTKLDEILSERQ